MAEHKLLGIIVAVGLVIVAAMFMVIDRHSSSPDDPEDATVAVAAPEPTEPSAQPQVEYPVSPTPLSGKIVVSKRPVEVLSSPSASASAVFGFPAGRPFRVLGGDGDYVKIQDLRSGASGWIEEAALEPAPPPAAKQRATGTSTKKTTTTGAAPKRKQTSSDTSTAAAEPKPEPKRQRRGLFGGGGVFGGLFGGR